MDGDERSAAIAAASIVAKVVRDRAMRRLDAVYPHYGFASHVGYITPGHSAIVRTRGPCEIHRRRSRPSATPIWTTVSGSWPPSQLGRDAERRVRRHYRLRGYRILATNARAGGNELDIVAGAAAAWSSAK